MLTRTKTNGLSRFNLRTRHEAASDLRERFNAAIDVPRRVTQAQARIVRESRTHEDCLLHLGKVLGELSVSVLYRSQSGISHDLERMFAFSVAWIAQIRGQDSPADFLATIRDVFAERLRQRELRRANPKKYPFALEHPTPDPKRKYRVVFEECGEVADALDKLESANGHHTWKNHLCDELTQVAAVCAAWLESFEVQS